jgi:hypothetical protein
MQEPGLDEHLWITEWEALEPLLRESPVEALSEVDDLVARMLEARGVALEEQDGEDVEYPETTREFAEARRITQEVDSGDSYDPGDIAVAVEAYRSLYASLLELSSVAGTLD